MNYLLYCIFRTSRGQGRHPPPGVAGKRVFVVARNGLSAAVSKVEIPDLGPAISPLLAYENVVKSIHRGRTVIPLRYGTVVGAISNIETLLEEHRARYEQLLRELDGQVEMGIRVLFQTPPADAPMIESSGTGYLRAQRQRYAREEQLSEAQQAAADSLRAHFSGIYSQSKMEWRAVADHTLLFFDFLLINKSVQEFRRAFRALQADTTLKLLLSGPWPPYSFVSEQ